MHTQQNSIIRKQGTKTTSATGISLKINKDTIEDNNFNMPIKQQKFQIALQRKQEQKMKRKSTETSVKRNRSQL